jgi:hypothetical protein
MLDLGSNPLIKERIMDSRKLNKRERKLFTNVVLIYMELGYSEEQAIKMVDRLIAETGDNNYDHVIALLESIARNEGIWQPLH